MLDTGEVGEGPVVESSVELAVHKAVEKVRAITGGVVEKVGAVPDKTRRGGRSVCNKSRSSSRKRLETEKNFSSKHGDRAEIREV